MKQFKKDKPVRWGFKFWVLACPETGSTYKFDVYTGKRLTKTNNGLGYDVVMNLMNGMFRQGYHLFVGNCEEELPKKPVGGLLAVCWPTVGRLLAVCRPTDSRQVFPKT